MQSCVEMRNQCSSAAVWMRPKCRWKFIHVKLLSHLKKKKKKAEADNKSAIIQTHLHGKSKTDVTFIKTSRMNWLKSVLVNPGWWWMDGKQFRSHSELSSSSHLLGEAGISSASWLGCNDVPSCDMSWESAIWGLQRQITDYRLQITH